MSGVDNLTPEAFQKALDEARAKGFDVVQADPYTLLLDLDSNEQIAQFEKVLANMDRFEHFYAFEVTRWYSKSGNLHVVVRLGDPRGPQERCLLEALLGGDPIRSLLNLVRLENGVEEPSVLFKPSAKINTGQPLAEERWDDGDPF